MKLVWSPEIASKAYIDTVKSCKRFKESGVAELLSAMAAGWDARFIVELWSHGGAIATSVGLAVAAHNTGARHVCIVPDDRSRAEYRAAIATFGGGGGGASPEVVVGEAEAVMAGLDGVDFVVVDCRRREFARALRVARVSSRGAVLTCKNAWQRGAWFRWQGVVGRDTRLVRSVFLPVGKGLDIAYIGSRNNGNNNNNNNNNNSESSASVTRKRPSRWIKHIDENSGEEHVFRE
ncbi:S-adenosyl-L-methionine-dependent methyltransferase [Senna tora]|uniref:S-adenosyl-L-methionine-dependent methyltransferase n=1 Tax=Senna tora TaxID=362788 RepID=A0A835CIS9_9FABA|nr:S-adenosyl-L-methionine-dependent methyltransferase [Senna tora]